MRALFSLVLCFIALAVIVPAIIAQHKWLRLLDLLDRRQREQHATPTGDTTDDPRSGPS